MLRLLPDQNLSDPAGFHSICSPLQFNRFVHDVDFTDTGITDLGLQDLNDLFKEVESVVLTFDISH